MTTAAVDWETAFAPGFDAVVCVLIEGVPVVLTPSGVHPTATAVTSGTIHSLWHFGVGTLTITKPDASTLDPVREWLDVGATWTLRETTKPVEGDVEVEALRFDLFDADGAATALLSAPLSRVARALASDVAATGNIPLDAVVGVASSGYLHVGRECVGYSSLSGNDAVVTGTGAGRGLFGSRARAHVVGAGTRRALAVADQYPRFWQGRIASVWLCKLVGTTLTDPTLVHLATIGAGVSLTSGLMRLQLPADHITTTLRRKFGKIGVRAFGFQHVAATLEINFVNTLSLEPTESDGWSPDAATFLRRLHAKGQTLATIINVAHVGGHVRLTATGPGSDVTWSITACWNNPNPRSSTTPNLGENLASPTPECVMHLDGIFSVKRAGDWDMLPSTLVWIATVGSGTGRAHAALVADTDNTKHLFAQIYARDAANHSLTLVADVPVAAPGMESVAREIASRITKPTEATLGVLASGDTALAALRALAAAVGELQGADAGDVSVDWEQIALVFASIPTVIPDGRAFHFTGDEDSLIAPLVHEARLRGAALCIRRGLIGVYRPAAFALTETVRRDITEDDLLSGVAVEVTDGMEPTATAMKFLLSNGDSYTWRDTTSVEEFGEGKVIECKALQSVTGTITPTMIATTLQATAQQILGVLAQPQRVIRVTVGPSFWSLDGGDLVTLTHAAIPDWHGNRGLTAALCQVMETRKSFGGGECRVQLALLLSDDDTLAGYAPSALVGSIVGAVVTIDTTSPWDTNCFAPDVDADGIAVTSRPLHGFVAGDKVALVELDNETPMTDEIFTIVSLTDTTVTLSSSPSGPMVTAASTRYGCLLRFAPWTNAGVNAGQREYLYIADATAEDLGTGDAPKRWAA
jgi:hypothetical protein